MCSSLIGLSLLGNFFSKILASLLSQACIDGDLSINPCNTQTDIKSCAIMKPFFSKYFSSSHHYGKRRVFVQHEVSIVNQALT